MLKRRKETEGASLESQINAIQNGDEQTRHHLLSNYQPFIATAVSKVCKRYIDAERDDEYSIGLMAFNDAINLYSEEKGSSFLTFARLVISRRVIDYIRSEADEMTYIPLDDGSDEEMTSSADWRLANVSKEAYELDQQSWYRQVEIEEYNEKLKEYKLSFQELVDICPKHKDAKESAKKVARFVYENDEIRDYVLEQKRLPIKKIEPHVNVSKKTIERNRRYILAIFVLFSEDFVYLREYVEGVN
ncbi:RNA polymerase sigma-I factor [Halalkalibacillus halophilus]|uniref:RNA polymerase sigma-I factor n=1 Tax=Halalkalibacillus halophilus TaxID=392827 RepID=UPI000415B60B|nr:RNA polymerase sigma-I factor [Halalkalibacillus halophilus]